MLRKIHLVGVGLTPFPANRLATATAKDAGTASAVVSPGDLEIQLEALEGWARGEEAAGAPASMADHPESMKYVADLLLWSERDSLEDLEAWAAKVHVPTGEELRQEAARARPERDNAYDNRLRASMQATVADPCGRCWKCRAGTGTCDYA